jgi:hypothetical protein
VRLAARQGHSDVIELLVSYGAAKTEAEVYRVVMGDQFVLPQAKNLDNRPNEEGDVIQGIDRNAVFKFSRLFCVWLRLALSDCVS